MKSFLIIFLCSQIILYAKSTKTDSKIYKGETARKNQFPHQAKLLVEKRILVCGGVIIHKRWILTTVQCIEKEPSHVEVGNYLSYPYFEAGLYEIDQMIPHNNYTKHSVQNNIALVHLKKNIRFSLSTFKIALPKNNDNQFDNYTVIASGWGLTKDTTPEPPVLRYNKFKVLEHKICKQITQTTYNYSLSESQLCTSTENDKRFCFGDSGSPIIADKMLIGIVSFGFGDCELSKIDIHTRVSSYLDWINSKINSSDTVSLHLSANKNHPKL